MIVAVLLGLFWFLCGNEIYTNSFFRKIVLKVLSGKHFAFHKPKLSHKVEKSPSRLRQNGGFFLVKKNLLSLDLYGQLLPEITKIK